MTPPHATPPQPQPQGRGHHRLSAITCRKGRVPSLAGPLKNPIPVTFMLQGLGVPEWAPPPHIQLACCFSAMYVPFQILI